MCYKLKVFLEMFGYESAVLNSEMPRNTRQLALQHFNAGLKKYLIATDESLHIQYEPLTGRLSMKKS